MAGDRAVSAPGFKSVDVTSGSMNKIGEESPTTLSPMRLGPVTDGKGVKAVWFENYWQAGKMWRTAGHIGKGGAPTPAWFKFREKVCNQKTAKRRPLPKEPYGTAESSFYDGRVMGYVESRKLVYVPIYRRLIEGLAVIKELKQMLDEGVNIMILDIDGPPKELYPTGLELNRENWDKMIDDPKYPFGHGWVVAALLANLQTDQPPPNPPPITTPAIQSAAARSGDAKLQSASSTAEPATASTTDAKAQADSAKVSGDLKSNDGAKARSRSRSRSRDKQSTEQSIAGSQKRRRGSRSRSPQKHL